MFFLGCDKLGNSRFDLIAHTAELRHDRCIATVGLGGVVKGPVCFAAACWNGWTVAISMAADGYQQVDCFEQVRIEGFGYLC